MTPARRSPAPSHPGPAGAPPPADPSSGSRARNAFLLASIAVVLAVAGLAAGAAALLRGGSDSCRTAAWDSEPAAADLPAGWSVATSQVGMDGLGVSLAGPAAEGATDTPTIYLTVSCYGADAATALERSRSRVTVAGEDVVDREDLGDGGYGLSDPASGSLAVHFRLGALLAYAATSGTVTEKDLDAVAAAVDAAMRRALGRGGPAVASPSAAVSPAEAASPSSGTASSAPSATAATEPTPTATAGAAASPSAPPDQTAPELVALFPTEVAGTTLTADSSTGIAVLGGGSAARALAAALGSLGSKGEDLRVAWAYDATETLDLSLLAFGIDGVAGSKLAPVILSTWLTAGADGVRTTTETVGGKEVTAVDYGDGGSLVLVRTTAGAVVIVQATDAAVAAEAIAALP